MCRKATFYPVAASFQDENGNCDATGEPLRKGDFLSLAHNAPFGLAPNQLRGVATGRFIAAHAWNGHRFLKKRSRFCVDMQRPWCHSEKMPRSRGRFGVLWGDSPASHRCKERHIKSEQHQRPSTQLRLTTLCDFASLPRQRIPEIGNFCALGRQPSGSAFLSDHFINMFNKVFFPADKTMACSGGR